MAMIKVVSARTGPIEMVFCGLRFSLKFRLLMIFVPEQRYV